MPEQDVAPPQRLCASTELLERGKAVLLMPGDTIRVGERFF